MTAGQVPFDEQLFKTIRAQLSPKRIVRTRLAILHNGNIPETVPPNSDEAAPASPPAAQPRTKAAAPSAGGAKSEAKSNDPKQSEA